MTLQLSLSDESTRANARQRTGGFSTGNCMLVMSTLHDRNIDKVEQHKQDVCRINVPDPLGNKGSTRHCRQTDSTRLGLILSAREKGFGQIYPGRPLPRATAPGPQNGSRISPPIIDSSRHGKMENAPKWDSTPRLNSVNWMKRSQSRNSPANGMPTS